MDHRDIHNIIKKVSSQLYCPHCRGKITSKSFQLTNIVEEDCVFTVLCPHCSAQLTLGAHIDHNQSWQDLVSNASTNIKKRYQKNNLSARDIVDTRKKLRDFRGSINKLFSTQ